MMSDFPHQQRACAACGSPGCQGACVHHHHNEDNDYKDFKQDFKHADVSEWFLTGPDTAREEQMANAGAAPYTYGASSPSSSGSPPLHHQHQQQPQQQYPHPIHQQQVFIQHHQQPQQVHSPVSHSPVVVHQNAHPSVGLPQIGSIIGSQIPPTMTTDAEAAYYERTEHKMELLQHQPLELLQHHELLTAPAFPNYLDTVNFPQQIFFAADPYSHHLIYDNYTIPSPSCTVPPSAFSTVITHQPSTASYTPPPQDPLAGPAGTSNGGVASSRPQKKRIQAVSCHSNSVCNNCGTRDTSLWRRNNRGDIECNACNLYYRKNNRQRPLSLKKGIIMKRNRKPRAADQN